MAEDDIGKLKKRFAELAERAERIGLPQETRFLNMAEQSVLLSMRLPVFLWGGFEGAERRVAVFGAEETDSVTCLRISPVGGKFAQELTHRDFLGSLMALGIVRETLGDIVVKDNCGYLFCCASVAPFIEENLTEVKRTGVRCEPCSDPTVKSGEGEVRSVVVASERLDAVIAAVWKLPREEAKALCEKGLVFVDARLAVKAGSTIPEGAAVSVRGKGRFTYLGLERETKKGKLRVAVSLP